ncbi:phosphate ABC transporter substrate-binding protein PstS [Salinibacterium sp. ZJ450]|uniref:phosphate ABC transporter substrate-binding protein PstS n=1 Tax=Salinibacterium sp. ZJ450 TaxID=2708338 RepID=UPI001CD31D65|nr:phosphate ABC transporter substrate-binding protein PstS [Salinibacterium sp. ZJ450]
MALLLVGLIAFSAVSPVETARAVDSWEPITGTGSTWSQNAIAHWRTDVAQDDGIVVNYSGVGSTAGRRDFIQGAVDFAVSELPFQPNPEDGSAPEVPPRGYTYVPLVAGGTAFMYHLKIDGQRVTDLRLSGETITKIFAGAITNWNDPAIQADNPGLVMPDKEIVPVVRSDWSGSTAQFTGWMSTQYPSIWPHGATQRFPTPANGKAQAGSSGVAGYVSQGYGDGAITYVENSYALEAGFPAAKVLNEAGYYVAPTAPAVSIALLGAQTDAQGVQQLAGVYNSLDARAYPLSTYSYMIVPTEVGGVFTENKGRTLGAVASYAVCEGQQRADALGYAPLPINLVQEASSRIASIPGASGFELQGCANPTFAPGDTITSNMLLATAPSPSESDRDARPTVPENGSALSVSVVTTNVFALVASLTDIDLGEVRRNRVTTGHELGDIRVIDDRDHLTGWDLRIDVHDFVHTADAAKTIRSSALGYAPTATSLLPGIALGSPQEAGSANYSAPLASGEPDSWTTEDGFALGAELNLRAPISAQAGTYRSTLTLTLLPR